MSRRAVLALVASVAMAACIDASTEPAPTTSASASTAVDTGPFTVRSSAFQPGQPIPREHTCDDTGATGNKSPPLEFKGLPSNTTSLALIMEDPDAPTMTIQHWRFWNLPANETLLPRAAKMDAYGAREGQAYRGPCPPAGQHRYFFYAYGVDRMLDLAAGASVAELRAALVGHVTAHDSMHGTYLRPNVPPV